MSKLTLEQNSAINNDSKNLIVSASAGSGKTFVLIEYITKLVVERHIPIRRILVLTFTRAAAGEMRERLSKALLKQNYDKYLLEQLDDLSIADISTIDAFCEKLIRRNIDKLELDENFSVLEDGSELKSKAFERAITAFEKDNLSELNEIYYSYRKNKNIIFDTILGIESFFSALYKPDDKINYFSSNQPSIFKLALKEANEDLLEEIERLKTLTQEVKEKVDEPKYQRYCDYIYHLLDQNYSENFIFNVKNLKMINLEQIPIIRGENRDEESVNLVKSLRQEIKNFLEQIGKYNFDDKILLEKQENGSLSKALLDLYKIYKEEYEKLKRNLDIVDFVDIENLALSLMENEEVLSSIQEKYDYVFVDEYQDTNRVQEAIIKPITKNSHFVAVGDPKQGIYGFRNATMEIMQQDIEDFSASGGVAFLRGNFRSDDRLLSFINKIFERVMTQEVVGLDYKQTSMLKGEVPFGKMQLPSVRVDVVEKPEVEKETLIKGVYSVKDDELLSNDKDSLEASVIVARIDELLMKEIYDTKLGDYRKVELGDIVVLFRSRNSLMDTLAVKLVERGYPVLVDSKQLAVQDGDVQMLLNLLKLLINKNDDNSLISVLASPLGGFTLDELASQRLLAPEEKHFYEALKSQPNDKIKDFYQMLDELKLKVQTIGLYRALNELFVNKNYFAYLKQDKTKYMLVMNFMQELKAKDLGVSEAISYFEETGGQKKGINEGVSDAIKLMTIHASKGLEYPIVILAGAGQKLEKPSRKNYEINEKLGLGTYAYNELTNIKCTTPVLEMIKSQNREKEMIDEIMIFYVAFTRAKNHLYIVGQDKINNLYYNGSPLKAKNYLQLIFYAFGESVLEKLKNEERVVIGDWELNLVNKVSEPSIEKINLQTKQLSEGQLEKVREYLNFQYNGYENCTLNFKNSVTGLNNLNQKIEKFDLESNEDFLNTGNAYHEALKLIDFEKVENIDDLNKQLMEKSEEFTAGYLDLINRELLLKNILIIKNLIGESKVYKEKQFVMKAQAKEIIDTNCEDELLVQGVVDMFAIGAQNYLVDYKYTQNKSNEKILEKYSKQLDIYSLAIEKAFGIKLNKKYILSLKNAELIEYFD